MSCPSLQCTCTASAKRPVLILKCDRMTVMLNPSMNPIAIC